jgi:hypothetical protein
MRKLFWILTLLTAYVWIVTGGHEQWMVEHAKKFYQFIATWLSDAEVDFQVQQPASVEVKKKRPRRWD